MRTSRKRIVLSLIVAAIGMVSLTLVVLSPLALRSLESIHNADWAKLGNIGQTYGAVSALLAALALVGVSLSVLFQVRESRANRIEAGRTRHFELVKILLEDPFFFQSEYLPHLPDDATKRLAAYINQRVQFWQMLWDFGTLSETELRKYLAPGLFATTAGRKYWEYAHLRDRDGQSRNRIRFLQILDESYKESVRQGYAMDNIRQVATPSPKKVAPHTEYVPLKVAKAASLIAAGVALGIAFRRAITWRPAR